MNSESLVYNFKKCSENDIEKICALQDEAFLHLESPDILRKNTKEMLKSCLKDPHYTIGAFKENNLVAFCILYDGKNTDENIGKDIGINEKDLTSVANIKLVIVSPQHRGNGLQKKLITLLEKIAQEKGKKMLCTTVSPYNTVSIKNFEALGFVFHSTKTKYGGLKRNIYFKKI